MHFAYLKCKFCSYCIKFLPKQTIVVKNVINLKCDGLPLLKKLQMVDTPLNHQLLSHSDWGQRSLRGSLRVNSVLLINKVPEIDRRLTDWERGSPPKIIVSDFENFVKVG